MKECLHYQPDENGPFVRLHKGDVVLVGVGLTLEYLRERTPEEDVFLAMCRQIAADNNYTLPPGVQVYLGVPGELPVLRALRAT